MIWHLLMMMISDILDRLTFFSSLRLSLGKCISAALGGCHCIMVNLFCFRLATKLPGTPPHSSLWPLVKGHDLSNCDLSHVTISDTMTCVPGKILTVVIKILISALGGWLYAGRCASKSSLSIVIMYHPCCCFLRLFCLGLVRSMLIVGFWLAFFQYIYDFYLCTASLHGSNLMHTHQHFAVKIKGISGHYCLLAYLWRVGRSEITSSPPLPQNQIGYLGFLHPTNHTTSALDKTRSGWLLIGFLHPTNHTTSDPDKTGSEKSETLFWHGLRHAY